MAVGAFGDKPTPEPNSVIMWAGLLSEIPNGWVLCDGNNGTDDLTGRFVRGIPDSSTDPGNTGGQDSLSLSTNQIPSHDHSGSTNSNGSHTHTFIGDGIDYEYNKGTTGYDSDGYGTNTGTAGGHGHSINDDPTGSGASIDNRPNYYEIAFLEKI